MKLYGIKNCDSVRKALKLLNSAEVNFEFVDIRSEEVECVTIERWLKHIDIDRLFNAKSAAYRKLGLKNFALDEAAKKEWLCRERKLIKRPVLEVGNRVVAGFDEKIYKEILDGQHST